MTASARDVALNVLIAILGKNRPLDDAFNSQPELAALEIRDRAFARLLSATVLRRLGQIDDILARCLEKPLPASSRVVHDILRLGAAQLLFLDTPPHAAVDTAVKMTFPRRKQPYAKLVNAVLRRIDREGKAWLAAQDAARLNTPDWLWDSWTAAYGEDHARAIATAHLHEAPLDITAKDPDADWTIPLAATKLPTGSLRRAGGSPVDLPGFDDGAWWVQDAAAALPARLLNAKAGQTIADLCAAPGGKTAQLAAAGAAVRAVERSKGRVGRLKSNLKRLGLSADIVIADAAHWRPDTPVDGVLLDAPCTATGTIRRHPDVSRLKRPADVEGLARAQQTLLRAAIDMVKPGGAVVYCTCSLQPEEGEQQIDAALAAGLPIAIDPIDPAEVGGLAALITTRGFIRTLPCHLADLGGMDGFFAARLRRL